MNMRKTLVVTVVMMFAFVVAHAGQADGWKPLFNGKDLSGWETWLTRPHKSVTGLDLKKNEKGEYSEAIGLNKDPKKVYTVVTEDGQPAIRISGEIFGALTSQSEFENYHLKLEFKWGQKKWPPRETAVRDSGLLYHCVGSHGGQSKQGPWMESLEIQIQERDCGDFYSVGGRVFVDVEGERMGDKGPIIYFKGGKKFTGVNSRIIRDVDHEKKVGEWNTIEILCVGNTCVHVVNGKVNMILTNPKWRVEGKEAPLTRGKIQIQSEGAEVFYRNIAVRPLTKIPDEYLK
jgi:3-keto-disaccharide hydrolase